MLRISKRLLSLLLALTLILSMTTVAFAKDYDLINKNTQARKDFFDLVDDIDFFIDVLYNPDQYVIEVNGKYYEVEQVDAATKDGTLIDEAVVGLEPVDLDTEEELKVVSVSAINANKLEIKFSQPVNESEAETNANYAITGLPTVGSQTFSITNSDFELQDDEKTVIATLKDSSNNNYVIPNNTTFVVLVQPIASKDDPAVSTGYFTKTITFNDTTRPAVKQVKYPYAGVAEIYFTEELTDEGTVTVFDGTTNVTGSVTIEPSPFVAGGDKLVISGLTANKTYTVNIVGAKDWSNNLILPNPTKVTVKSTVVDDVAPEVVSVKATGVDSLEIKFSEALKVVGSNNWDKYATIAIDSTDINGGTQSFDAETNTLTVTGITVSSSAPTAGIHNVTISGYKDLAGNDGAAYSKAVEFKATAPALQKVEVKTISGVRTLVLTFDKNIDATAAAGVTGTTGTYITPGGVEKDFATGTITAANISVSGNELRIDISGFEAGDYTLTIPKTAIAEDGVTSPVNPEEDLVIEFTVPAAADTEKAEVANVYLPGDVVPLVPSAQVPRNEIYVEYDKSMGTSAINKSNYVIEGAPGAIKSAVFKGDNTLVKLTLEDDTITLNGDYYLAISSNVKGENGVAIDQTSIPITLTENVRPTLESATLIDATTIRVTFSEDMKAGTLTDNDDFKVTVNGAEDPITNVAAVADDAASFDITITTGVTDLAEDVVKVELLKDADATDANDNPVRAPKVIDVHE